MNNKRGRIAIAQILILILGIVAVSYAIGSEARILQKDIPLLKKQIREMIKNNS